MPPKQQGQQRHEMSSKSIKWHQKDHNGMKRHQKASKRLTRPEKTLQVRR
jgi:hypothetical protein